MVELVQKLLEISTAHLPLETVDRIESGGFPKPAMMESEYGFLFSVPQASDFSAHIHDMGIDCESFILCLQRAAVLGCGFLLFDCDAPMLDDLPVFDW